MIFRDRTDAGRKLAARLPHYADRKDLVVLALPRGGVPVGYEVARKLNAPLDVFMVRKLGTKSSLRTRTPSDATPPDGTFPSGL